MKFEGESLFELRTDPTTGRRVLIAEGRALRPNDFSVDAPTQAADHSASCPFCRGNEHQTPHELAVANDAAGEWQVRVVPNKYPALHLVSGSNAQGLQSLGVCAEPLLPHGVHEVIIESPRHVRDWVDLSIDELATVLRTFRDRIEHAYTTHQMQAALVFKNVGEAAGASLEHVHTQLVAFPFMPEVLQREVDVAIEHHNRTGECLMCELVHEELRLGTRLVNENDSFAAFTAYAGRQPYETWILPKRHASSFTHLSNEESRSLALILSGVVRQLSSAGDLRPPLAYNVVLHTAPAGNAGAAAFHWHWELIPRSASLAGFEWGSGMYINSVSPERAAIRLRMSKSGEKLPIQ
jgi:UDPglucose--hexose-1-phosphate uridylyltransferase